MSEYGARFTPIALAGGGVVYAVGQAFYWVMFPGEQSELAGGVTEAATNPGAWQVETILFALAHLALLPGLAGLIVALGRRKPLVATIGGVFGVTALYFSTVHLWQHNALFGPLAAGGVGVEATRPIVNALEQDPFIMISYAIWVFGFMIGLIVLGFGSWRAGLVSLWVPLALTGGQVLDFLSGDVAPKLVVSVLMGAGLVGLALGIRPERAAGAEPLSGASVG